MQVVVEMPLDGGTLALSDLSLGLYVPPPVTQRSTYSLAGQAVAVRVTSNPAAESDGLFYLYSDHPSASSGQALGSTSAMTDAAGNLVGDVVRYYPFGDYRAAPTSQQSAISDRGFTGHKSGENGGSNDIGLIYMNARFYVSGIGRFASADSVVPDPANPQSYNRYSYVENRPLVAVDPTGHDPAWCNDPYDAGSDPVCGVAGAVAPLPGYVLLYQITLNDKTKDPFQGTLTFIDSNAALTSNHFLGEFTPADIYKLSILSPTTGEEIAYFESDSIKRMAVYTGNELGDMENGLSLIIFPQDIVSDMGTASMGELNQAGDFALQAITFTPGIEDGLYPTRIDGFGNGQRQNRIETYPAIFVTPTSTSKGDSGAPLIVNGRVRGINNGQGGEIGPNGQFINMGVYGRITNIELLRSLIANYSP